MQLQSNGSRTHTSERSHTNQHEGGQARERHKQRGWGADAVCRCVTPIDGGGGHVALLHPTHHCGHPHLKRVQHHQDHLNKIGALRTRAPPSIGYSLSGCVAWWSANADLQSLVRFRIHQSLYRNTTHRRTLLPPSPTMRLSLFLSLFLVTLLALMPSFALGQQCLSTCCDNDPCSGRCVVDSCDCSGGGGYVYCRCHCELSTGAIIGIVIGSFVVLVICIFLCRRRYVRRRAFILQQQQQSYLIAQPAVVYQQPTYYVQPPAQVYQAPVYSQPPPGTYAQM